MKLKLVMFSAKRTSPAGNEDSDESDEVLKCFDGKCTLPCLDLWRGMFETQQGLRIPTLFFHRTVTAAGGGGKLPWRKMLHYSGELEKKPERVTGEEHHSGAMLPPCRIGATFLN